ncbi:MAG: ribonuclease III domain-containing protein [Microcoleus sp.]
MTGKGTNAVQDNLQTFRERLEAARKMQNSWTECGLDFVDLYVEDAGGDWLQNWGKTETIAKSNASNASTEIEAVKRAIGLPNFQQTELLKIAVIDYCKSDDRSDYPTEKEVKYQRLILLGRAMFGAVVSDYLYCEYMNCDRDSLSTVKAYLTDKKQLSEFARSLRLNELKLPETAAKATDKKDYNKLLSETFEAVFGAVYLECDRDFMRAGNWSIEHFIEPAVSENFDRLHQQQIPPESDSKRLAILGADILEAIAIDYLYTRFPEAKASQLTKWKNKLLAREIFPKNFKAKLGSQYLELGGKFSRIRDWLVDNFIKTAVDEMVEETGDRLK